MSEGVITVDARGQITDLNQAAQRLTGWTRESALGQPCDRVFRLHGVAEPDRHPIFVALRARQAQRSEQAEVLLTADDRDRLSISWQVLPDPASGGAVLLFEDVTAYTLLTEELAFRACHDTLTGLLNREEFERRLQQALADAQRRNSRYRVCFLDLDQFRLINDTAGHPSGDQMLRQVAAVLRTRLREGDVLARLGGDEFGLLLTDQDPAGTNAVLKSLQEAVRYFRFRQDDRSYRLTVSIGTTALDAGTDSIARIMREADASCRTAKEGGRDRVYSADSETTRRYDEWIMMGRFTRSLEQNRFVLFTEDVVDLHNPRRVVYRELLVRWRNEQGRLIMPSAFIRAAERYYLITPMDRWVVKHALRHLAARPDDGVIHAINLSGQSLGNDNFLDFVLAQLQKTGVAPRRICFEITETAAIARLSVAVQFIRRLSQAGVRFSLDDFGAGMASFSYLKNLPVHFLKIDGNFIQSMQETRVDRDLVEAINRIGHDLGLLTIAENVESLDLLEPLRGIGVDWAQGRAIAEGRPLEAL
ncbi:MAG: EAL domain-containing protein [Nevskiales bacterium]|nr:EAL domain-containing protein [Nevskiales bacterium]